VVSVTPRHRLQEAEGAPGSVTLAKKISLVPTGDRAPYRPACGESRYRLRYPSPNNCSGGSSSSTIIISVVLVDSVKKSSLPLFILHAFVLENLCIVPL
jgi:hypothetical protein